VRTECEVLRINLDKAGITATGVTYVESSGPCFHALQDLVLFRGYERDEIFAGEVLLAACAERRKAGSIALRRHQLRLWALLGHAFGKWRPHVQLTVDEIGAAGILSPGAEFIARDQPIDDGLDRRRLVMRKELPWSWSLYCGRRTVKRLPRQRSRISSGHSARQVSDRKRAGGRSQELSSRGSRHSGPSNDQCLTAISASKQVN
jgi:hypothetical protein